MLRFVSFYFVYLFYFSFVEDILKQYLKNENYHYHFPFSLINSSFEIKKKNRCHVFKSSIKRKIWEFYALDAL